METNQGVKEQYRSIARDNGRRRLLQAFPGVKERGKDDVDATTKSEEHVGVSDEEYMGSGIGLPGGRANGMPLESRGFNAFMNGDTRS